MHNKNPKKQTIIHIDHDYFSEQNILQYPERMIIVGFIAADGCISERHNSQNSLIFNISDHDKIALDIINNEIAKGKRNITYLKGTNSNILSFPSNKICKDLERYNIVSRKSNIYDLPKNLKNIEMQYFLKGYFYGDGCIVANKKSHNGIFLVGTEQFSKNVKKYLETNNIIDSCPIYDFKNHECKQIRICGRMTSKFSKYLFFDDKLILLPRKNIIIEDNVHNCTCTIEEIKLLKYENDVNKIVKLTGRNITTIKCYKTQIKKNKFKSIRFKNIFESI